jgi:HNH endonuclease
VRKIRASVLALIPNPRLRYRVDGATGCWVWAGAVNEHGYGIVGAGRHGTFRAHRVSYELARGPIPPGLQLDHLCRNRRCINPEHLEPVTNAENSRRGARAKLDWPTVRLIRRRYARERISHRRLASIFGVSNCTICKVLTGRFWREEGQP